MRKILLCHTLFPSDQQPHITGGAELCSRDLARGLATYFGHHVEVLRGLAPGTPPRTESLGAIPVHALPLRRPYWLYDGTPRAPWEKLLWHARDDAGAPPEGAAALIARLRPDTVILGNIVGLGWQLAALARAQGAKVVQVLHDYYHLCPAMTMNHHGKPCGPFCRLLTTQRRRGFHQLDGVIGVSRAVLAHHRTALGPHSHTTVIHNTPRPYQGPIPPRGNRPPVFGFLGRISPEKGLDTLLDALPFGAILNIGGTASPAQQAALRARARRDIRLTFLGFVTPETFFPHIDVLVVPSVWEEPLGLVSLEAQAAGVPVIVAGKGGLPETLIAEKTGWIIPADSPNALAERLAAVMADPSPLSAMSKAARAHMATASEAQTLGAYNAFLTTVHQPPPPQPHAAASWAMP